MPQNWKTYKLGDLSDITMGQSPKGINTNKCGEGLPLLNGPTEFGYSQPTPTQYTTDPKKVSNSGDLLFCVRGSTTGRMNYSNIPYALGRGLCSFRGRNGYSTRFIKYLIDYELNNLLNITTGSTFPNLSKNDINLFKVKSPDYKEANKIAQVLSAIDDKIENNLAINKTLEEMAMALYKHWFLDFGPFQDGAFVKSELGKIPEGWEVKKIGDLYNTSSGGTPSRKKMEYYENGEIPWIKSKELNNTFIINTEEKITSTTLKKSSAKLFPAKSVLVAMYGATVGEVGINSMEATCNQAICAIKTIEIPYFYVFIYLKVEKEKILNQAVGSAQQNISQILIKNFPIISPKLIDVKNVFDELSAIFNKLEKNIIENQTLTHLRDTLLPKLISGEVRLKEFREAFEEVE